ncbi:flagellar hook-length control protein FliK [bacterium]|nr:flagellar hook-length control protein FliK [bacterium]
MTQAVTNTLNNLEQMISTQTNLQKMNEGVSSAMDKTKDFTKVFESTLNKDVATIDDMKMKFSKEDSEITSSAVATIEFKEILQEVTEEANAETSLDLTLAKDVEEIISELKEAVENTTELIEENTDVENAENVEVSDEITSIIEENVGVEDLDTEFDGAQDSCEQEQKVPFEQVLTFVDNSLSSLKNSEEFVQEENDSFKFVQEKVEFTSNEILEFAEDVSSEVILPKATEEQDNAEFEMALDEEIIKELNIESISSEAESFNGESLMQNQTPEEQAVKAVLAQDIDTFEVKLDSNSNVQNSQQVSLKSVDVNPSKIIDQISKHLEGLHNNSKVNIVLNPESLGKVNVQLMSTKEGITAQFIVTTQEARDLISKGLDGLKEALGNQGVAVDNVSVKVADSQKSEYKQDWTEQEGSRGGNKGQGQSNREEKEKGLFEKMMAQTVEEENGNV